MCRLTIPTVAQSPEVSKPPLDAVSKKLGVAPNLMKLLGNSPAGLEGYLSFSGALDTGRLDARLRESLALVVAEFNGCDYWLAAHSCIAEHRVKLADNDIAQARDGRAPFADSEGPLRTTLRERGREPVGLRPPASRPRGTSHPD